MQTLIARRRFLTQLTVGAAFGVAGPACQNILAAATKSAAEPSAGKLPRWHGFNLLEKFNGRNDPFKEQDFEWISEFGFNFVRLPMDYRMWIEDQDWTKFHEPTLKQIDDAVDFGRKHGVHVCLNFHRAPGYTVAKPPEKKSVWSDDEALRVCALHWTHFAKRYQGVPNRNLSFNLFNEPPDLKPETYRRVVAHLVDAIRGQDSKRLIICDGRNWGNTPPAELAGLGVAAATRGYNPIQVSHYKASWMPGSDTWPEPTWPLHEGNKVWDKKTLRERQIAPWQKLQRLGVGVIVGEFGAHNRTPHDVVLAWLRDYLDLWKQAGWGWAMWNFTGSFGILDSGRVDVDYENWRGHKLDRKLLNLLKEYSG